MKTMFPEMDREIAQDRLATRRERVQRAREYLRGKEGYEKFIVSHLEKHGPTVDTNLILEMMEITDLVQPAFDTILTLWAMWTVGKLKRKPFPNHPSGEKCYIYILPATPSK